jgi:uncharacterized protein
MGEGTRPPRRFRGLDRATVRGVEVWVADRLVSRLLGLALLRRERADGGLLLPRCRCVHTFWMRFELDLVFLDGGGEPIEVRRSVPAGRIVNRPGAAAVLELPAGPADAGPVGGEPESSVA